MSKAVFCTNPAKVNLDKAVAYGFSGTRFGLGLPIFQDTGVSLAQIRQVFGKFGKHGSGLVGHNAVCFNSCTTAATSI